MMKSLMTLREPQSLNIKYPWRCAAYKTAPIWITVRAERRNGAISAENASEGCYLIERFALVCSTHSSPLRNQRTESQNFDFV